MFVRVRPSTVHLLLLPFLIVAFSQVASAQVTQIYGVGAIHTLDYPTGVATDLAGNVFVSGSYSDNVFRIAPGGTVTEIISSAGRYFDQPRDVTTDPSGNVFVASGISNNVFKITAGGTITEIIDDTV